MNLTKEMETYILECQGELRQLIRDLSVIPAPSHHEERRAAFCREWFAAAGFQDPSIDSALNVVTACPSIDPSTVTVFMAHTDVVFPDTYPLPFREEDGAFFCPGVCDDTANLAVMMICARYFIKRGLRGRNRLLFVANSCEEGLGNLKGSREIVHAYGERMNGLITFDGVHPTGVTTRPVGSHRYRVSVVTEGGHSYEDYGNRNAIRILASMIDALYRVKIPDKAGTKTTCNVGTISGGTSVNAIAQQAEMLYEYRSDDQACLAAMKHSFDAVIDTYRATGITVTADLVGDRPCAKGVDMSAHEALIALADRSIQDVFGSVPRHESGSTDANSAMAAGIPAICLSAVSGNGCHTREERLNLDSLLPGCRLAMDFMANYFAL